MTGFDAAIAMGFLATGIASFARSVHVEMAGLILGTCPRTVMTELTPLSQLDHDFGNFVPVPHR